MADITWSAYALAMFTPEERAAAAAQTYEPPIGGSPPPAQPVVPVVNPGLGLRITGPGIGPEGLDPNNPAQAAMLFDLGWRFDQGKWIAPRSPGVAATADQAYASSGGRPPGLSSVTGVSSFASGSVLGVTIPQAPAVMLPSWVGGAIGHIVRSGGTRPESGGTLRIIKGEGHKYAWTRVVR